MNKKAGLHVVSKYVFLENPQLKGGRDQIDPQSF